MVFLRQYLFLLGVFGAGLQGLFAEDAINASHSWDEAIPLLEKYCFDCHDADVSKGDIDLAQFRNEAEASKDPDLWETAKRLVHDYEMPPSDKKKQPSEEEREVLLGWMKGALDRMALANAGDPGKVTMRRLTNSEFDNTIRDLTGLRLNLSRNFSKDGGGGEGFANTGDVLFTSPEQIEKYLKAIRTVTGRASILPGSGIQFRDQEVGVRGPKLAASAIEFEASNWYRERAEPMLPKTHEELRIKDYAIALWKHSHRDVTGAHDLAKLAKDSQLDPDFLANWNTFLTAPKPDSRFTAATWHLLRSMPGPDKANLQAVPADVEKMARWVSHWRHAWLVEDSPGYTVQRRQQDIDSLNETKLVKKIDKAQVVTLAVTDAGDGNAGDIVHWTKLTVKRKDGTWHSMFAYWEGQRKWCVDHLAKLPADDTKAREKTKRDIADLEKLLALKGTHPDGTKLGDDGFAVRAPSRISFWADDSIAMVHAIPELQQDHPQRDKASVQCVLRRGEVGLPDPLPGVFPGVNILWHRGTAAHYQTMAEFRRMKKLFPDTHDRRVKRVEGNLKRKKADYDGIYHLNDEQFSRRLPEHERALPKAFKIDYYFARQAKPSEKVAHAWSQKLVGHLHEFAARAWRRPLSGHQKKQIWESYLSSLKESENREDAAREAMVRILLSPHFLFKTEPPHGKQRETKLDAWELSSRLSYFLWGSMPDDAMRAAAKDGSILDQAKLDGRIKPMLADWKSHTLARDFAGQWFGFADFRSHSTVDGEKFKAFWGDGVRWSMYREAITFFEQLVKHDRPVTDILHANYSFIDGRLAEHYGVPDFDGSPGNFKEWDLSAQGRGGLLGMGAVLVKTSYPRRTSPVLRGDWVLRTVLGQETPPPPVDVPELEDDGLDEDMTLRERLEKHRDAKACAGCHSRIDPPGFALENFDAVGRWRDRDEDGRPIDATATLRNGQGFVGIGGLKSHLKNEEAAFLRQFCTKLLGYALGREVGIGDRPLLEAMEAALARDGYLFSAAVRTIVQSRQFRNRRNH